MSRASRVMRRDHELSVVECREPRVDRAQGHEPHVDDVLVEAAQDRFWEVLIERELVQVVQRDGVLFR